MIDLIFCKGKTVDKRWPYQRRPCTRKAGKDGYCKAHHPDEKKKRHKKRMDEKERMFQESVKRLEASRVSDLVKEYKRLTTAQKKQFKKAICINQ